MRMANAIGPARSPMVLLIPKLFSARVDAHWLTACSLAPAQSIISIRTQKIFFLKSSTIVRPVSPSSSNGAIGTLVKRIPFKIGINDHVSAIYFQFAMPKILKNSVERSTTPTCPQQ